MIKILTYTIIILIIIINPTWSDEQSKTEASAQQNLMFLDSPDNILLDSVLVKETDPVPDDEIKSIILSKKGGILNDGLIEHDVNALAELFHKSGWWKAQASAHVDTLQPGSAILIYTVKKGNPAILGRLSVKTEEKIPEFISLPESELYGKLFSSQLLDQTVQDIVSQFTEKGYPDVVLNPSLSAYGDTVDVSLMIQPGNRAHIDSIAVNGLSRTKDYVVRRELSHLYGSNAGQDIVSTARILIGKMNYVHPAQDPYIDYSDDDKCILVLNLNEGKQGSFDGIIGYQPSSDGEGKPGEMVGKIDLAFPNIVGTGRSSRIRWENLGKDTEDIELLYTEPWVFGFPYNVSGSFVQEQREKLDYTKTIIQSAISRDIGWFHTSGGYRYEKVSSDSVYSSSAHGIDIGISWENIDNPENPTTGILYAVRWTNVSKKYRFGTQDSHRLERLEFDLDHYIPTLTGQTLAVLVRYRRVDTPAEKLSLSDRYWLGGSTSIRGYREEIFPAVNALWATTEYRIIRGRASWVFLFVDSGYLTNKIRDLNDHYSKKTIHRTGYGFGIRIESRAGTLGFDYGFGKGNSLGEGKLHVSLASSF